MGFRCESGRETKGHLNAAQRSPSFLRSVAQLRTARLNASR